MKVILLSDLRHRGRRGQVVDVKPGYARNFLLPQGIALEATPGNLKYFDHQKKKIEARHESEREVAAGVAAAISALRLSLRKRAMENGSLYGSVTAGEVVDMLAAQGIEIDRRQVDLGGGIKALGEHVVRIDLHSEVVAELPVTVEAEE
ncbi:MAG: 50S ribosomal protein L9 [Thermoanaerobaculia bacterium]|jgi:large subunit ribosomal protein L9|nr:MAG: 50S ribosomal protein L9 [Thermoanaerobaculia bacterium]MBZ0103551.1 50S ribosomal protein L9 [Thermoanaerobaculia bacterium]